MFFRIYILLGHWIGGLSPIQQQKIARFFSYLIFDVLRFRRRLILKNLEIYNKACPLQRPLQAVGRDSIYHFMLTILELLGSEKRNISANVQVKGKHFVTEALAEGKGAYVICCHISNWEAMGSAFTRQIAPAHVLVKKIGQGAMNDFVDRLRHHNQFLTVKRQKKGDGYEAIRKILAAGEIVGFVMDQARPGEPKIEFFGEPAKTNTSLAAIWRRNPAPILPAFILRDDKGGQILEILPPLQMQMGSDPARDIVEHSKQFNIAVETIIKRCPEQYFWLHNRWK
jgi:KDO2-lipid IV(A) lauroyltransferase